MKSNSTEKGKKMKKSPFSRMRKGTTTKNPVVRKAKRKPGVY